MKLAHKKVAVVQSVCASTNVKAVTSIPLDIHPSVVFICHMCIHLSVSPIQSVYDKVTKPDTREALLNKLTASDVPHHSGKSTKDCNREK